jgi:predicted nucleic acid-binding Zn ribbon protein
VSDPFRLRDLLDPITARFGMDGASSAGAVWARWAEVVGDTVALHAEPTSLRRGVLRIRTDSPTWATEIGYLGDDICARANEIAGRSLVREVRVWTSPDPVARRDAAQPRRSAEEGEQTETERAPTDPLGALERARNAWAKRAGKARSEGFDKDPGNG